MNDLAKLQQSVGHQFTDITLLQRALKHRSAGAHNNERLEFLGDGLLNFIIAEALYHHYPDHHEGLLSRMRANLVNGVVLSEIASALQLESYIQVGAGERKSGNTHNQSILADAMEAIIAAIYQDSSFTACRKCVINLFKSRIHSVADSKTLKDPKTRLQEAAQAKGLSLPTYVIKSTTGRAHEQLFTVECTIQGFNNKAIGQGSSRRRAEQAAAEKYLESFNE